MGFYGASTKFPLEFYTTLGEPVRATRIDATWHLGGVPVPIGPGARGAPAVVAVGRLIKGAINSGTSSSLNTRRSRHTVNLSAGFLACLFAVGLPARALDWFPRLALRRRGRGWGWGGERGEWITRLEGVQVIGYPKLMGLRNRHALNVRFY